MMALCYRWITVSAATKASKETAEPETQESLSNPSVSGSRIYGSGHGLTMSETEKQRLGERFTQSSLLST